MFKKSSKRNLRQREESDDEDKHSGARNESAVVNIASLKTQREKRHKNKTKGKTSESSSRTQKSVLSFADDEEDDADAFKTKKSSRSSRIARHIKKLNEEEKQKGEEGPNGGYTAEDLEELRKLSMRPVSLETNSSSVDRPIPFPTNESADSKYSGIETASRIQPGDIPNANHIHAARKQREMMRNYGTDYIPIQNKKFVPEDEDLDGSGSDEGPSIEMRGIIDDGVRVINQISAYGESDLHRDEEFDLWEAEMIKKGISTQQTATTTAENDFKASKKATFSQAGDKKSNDSYETYTKVSNPGVKTSLVPQEATKLMKTRLAERLSALNRVHYSRKQDLERATLDVKESEDSAGNLLDLTTLSTQYSYFQDTRAHIADLVDCLTEKNAEIETLETRRYRIWKKKVDAISSRRQKDMEDESSDISSAISGAKVQTAPSNEKQARMREREGRRSYRRAMRQRSGIQFHFEGMSTDDEESATEKTEQYMEFQKIANYKSVLFEDVMEEFYNVKLILSKFEEWMNKHPKTYKDAYIDLCVPKLLTPFVRLAMLEWNPLGANCPGIESMIWYQDLLFFGAEKSCSEYEAHCGSPENKILSSVVDKVLLTKMIHLVKEVWDPLSKTQSSRLSTLLCKFAQTYPCMRSDNRRCGELLLAICTRIQQTIERDAFIPLYPTSALTTVAIARCFFERRSWACIKLFQNILAFSNTLSQSALIELAFTLLLNRYIMLSLQTSPVTAASVYKCQCIADAIPSDWLANVDSLSIHFEPFSRYLLHSAKHIHTQLESCNEAGKQRARYCIAQLGKILLFLGFNDMSQAVAELLA